MRLPYKMRCECYKRYLSSCSIKKTIPKFQDIIHIFFTWKIEVPFFDFNVNNVCSLKCKKCDQGIPYLNEREVYDFTKLKKWMDLLLEKVNYVYQIAILGGEPFLNKDLDKIITYCINNKKIGSVIIVTNGTIFPSNRILSVLKNDKIIVGISWYPLVNDNSRKRLINFFEINGINYTVRRTNWLDFGDWKYSREYTDKYCQDVFCNCFLKDCWQYNKGILYHCTRQRLLLDQKIDEPNKYEIIDLENVSKREFIYRFKQFTSLKSLKSCNYCNSGKKLKSIPLGEQL